MKQIFINKGKILIKECPIPIPLRDEVLVQLSNSVISSGTEVAGIEGSKISLLKKVLSKPSKAFNHIAKSGLRKSFDFIKARKNLILPTGYSATGKIIKLGKNIKNLKINDNIACAGSSSAFHAEYIRVPEKLCVKVPAALDDRYASTVAIGSIALHGVRRSSPTLGEIFVVVGLGIIGQITLQLLKANGCRVIAVDPDLNRLKIAKENGADYFFSDLNIKNKVDFISNFEGVDAVIITASKKSDSIISQSFGLTRKKGRIVIVGDVGLNLKRQDFYEKEIDVLISSSYGPGRYDKNYENKNLDYPISYVRWTEQRNMQEYLRLLESKKVNLNFILKNEYKFEHAIKAYNDVLENKNILTAVLKYKSNNNKKKINFNFLIGIQKQKKINLGVIGAGSFFYETRIPLILKNKKYLNIVAIQNTDGYKTLKSEQYLSPKYLTTNPEEIINDKKINTILISTQHQNHGELVIKSLKKNKNVFIEKPITIYKNDLKLIKKYYSTNKKKNILFTGYNRRYSPLILTLKKFLDRRTGPVILNYKMNVENLPDNHWLNDIDNGGRNIGEACHIYDLFIYLVNSEIKNIKATSIEISDKKNKENFISTILFKDGSVANLIYTTIGSKKFSKETLEVFCDNEYIFLDDYKKIDFYENKNLSSKLLKQEKGYNQEFQAFIDSLREGRFEKSIQEQILSMEIAFKVDEEI